MYSYDRLARKKIPDANQLAQLPIVIKYGQLMRQLTAKSKVIFFRWAQDGARSKFF